MTGKFLGFEPEKGDTLVYRILPDHMVKGEATHWLVRSVIEPDSVPNYRTGLMRSLPPQMEPFDEPPEPPRRSSRLSKDKDNEPLLSLRRQNLDQKTPLPEKIKIGILWTRWSFLTRGIQKKTHGPFVPLKTTAIWRSVRVIKNY